jgi:hypothetical protein
MNRLIDAILGVILVLSIGSFFIGRHHLVDRKAPIHKKIPHTILPIINEYKQLALDSGIRFARPVTIGFNKIDEDLVIGVCYSGSDFREVDLDTDWWIKASTMSHRTLVFHELTHCFCGRQHDYGWMQIYPEAKSIRMSFWGKRLQGYLEDGCPISIMHPIVIDDYCMSKHSTHYFKEMFERCSPW